MKPSKGVSEDDDLETGAMRSNTLSGASKRYDVGGKGFLSASERELRQYDTNNDGNLDVSELKQIVHDLKNEKREKSMLKKIAKGGAGCLVLSFLGNFGLIWAVLVLTRQLDTSNGSLVDSSTGKTVSTQNESNLLQVGINPEFSERLNDVVLRRRLAGDRDLTSAAFHEDIQRLTQATPPGVLDDCDKVCLETKYTEYQNGVSTQATIVIGDKTYTGAIASGITKTVVDTCDTYEQIKEVGTDAPLYKIDCCNSDDCTITPVGDTRFLHDAIRRHLRAQV